MIKELAQGLLQHTHQSSCHIVVSIPYGYSLIKHFKSDPDYANPDYAKKALLYRFKKEELISFQSSTEHIFAILKRKWKL